MTTLTIGGRARHRAVRFVRLRAVLGWIGAAAVLAVAWVALGPTAIGGPTSYVLTSGTSMLPHLHAGGVVMTRAESDYRVGEVVAYHNRQLKVVVLHRIVARDGARYVFKGDNNDFRDSYHPTRSDLIGREWVYWPGGGRYLALLRNPAYFGLVLGLLGFLAASGGGYRRQRP